MRQVTLFVFGLVLGALFLLQAQTLDYKMGYQFPTIDQDSVLSGNKSIRGMDYSANLLGDGVAAIAITNYADNGHVSVFKNTGDDAMELVWTSPAWDSLGGGNRPRFVKFADLDNDGLMEVIAPFNRNGIAIYEWDGVSDSWNFGTKPSRIIGNPLYPIAADSGTSYSTVEYLDVADVDNDGQPELMFANNSTGSHYDRYYVFSIDGDYSTDDPGFSTVNREAMYYKNEGEYASYGGGTPYAVVAADLDGDGHKEMVFHNWNYGHFTVVTASAPNTYQLAEKGGQDTSFVYGNYPDDCVSLGGGTAYDIDGDGRQEVFLPLYSANGLVEMIHFEDGQSLRHIDSSNVFMIDMDPASDARFDFFGRPGIGDFDNDGKPNVYVSARHGNYIMSAEFQGGDKTDQNNWVTETIYTGDDLDSKIYSAMTITDSASVVDTSFTLQANSEGTIAMKSFSMNSDFDGDKHQDMFMPSQTWKDSIAVTSRTFVRDTAFTHYDTMYANTDSMTIDTLDFALSIYDTTKYNLVEPNRVSLRFLESSAVFTGLRAKDLTIITPDDYKLQQNYPNPFNPTTNIEFYLPLKKTISLTIYNTNGEKIKSLISNKEYSQGKHILQWNGTNNLGAKVATGMYIYKLKFGNFSKSMRMMLLK